MTNCLISPIRDRFTSSEKKKSLKFILIFRIKRLGKKSVTRLGIATSATDATYPAETFSKLFGYTSATRPPALLYRTEGGSNTPGSSKNSFIKTQQKIQTRKIAKNWKCRYVNNAAKCWSRRKKVLAKICSTRQERCFGTWSCSLIFHFSLYLLSHFCGLSTLLQNYRCLFWLLADP